MTQTQFLARIAAAGGEIGWASGTYGYVFWPSVVTITTYWGVSLAACKFSRFRLDVQKGVVDYYLRDGRYSAPSSSVPIDWTEAVGAINAGLLKLMLKGA